MNYSKACSAESWGTPSVVVFSFESVRIVHPQVSGHHVSGTEKILTQDRAGRAFAMAFSWTGRPTTKFADDFERLRGTFTRDETIQKALRHKIPVIDIISVSDFFDIH